MPDRRYLRVAPLLLTLALAGCGAMPEPTPAPAPPSATAAPTTPLIASPAASPTARLTLGELASRVGAAWANVESYRVVSTVSAPPIPAATPVGGPSATPVATPIAPSGTIVATREILLPNIQRVTVTGWGENDFEAMSDGESVYVRGPLASQIDPAAGTDTWLTLHASDVPAGSQLANLLGGLPAIPMPPFAGIEPRLEPQELRDLGTREVDGRTCQVYGAADTKLTTGTRMDLIFGIDADDLPCFIETQVGTTTYGHEEFSGFNEITSLIMPPAGTPVAIPHELAEPAHHD